MAFIYALCEFDGDVIYIGKANDVNSRFSQHLRETRRDYPVYRWIKKRAGEGRRIKCVVLACAISSDWQSLETFLINQHRLDGANLLNVAIGGDEPACPKLVRAKNGAKVSALVHSNPKTKRLWEIKRMLGQLLKDGCVSEILKGKMRCAAISNPRLFGEWAAI